MLAVRLAAFAAFFAIVEYTLLWAGLDHFALFLFYGVSILMASLLVTFATLGVFVIEPARESDEELRSNKREHDAVMANQRNQGLVLDMDAYYNGTERYIAKEAAEKQKKFINFSSAGKTLVILGGKVPVWF